MPRRPYADFDLRVERSGDGYRAWAESLTGEAGDDLRLSLSASEIASFLPHLRGRRGRNLRRPSGKTTDLRRFGHQLFRSLFRGDVEICWRKSLVQAAAHNLGLRLRLRLNGVPELARLPWEYLCDPEGDFLALSADTPVVRYPELPRGRTPLAVSPPFRVLVLIASPSNLPPLQGDEEMRQIQDALRELVDCGQVVLDRVVPATFTELLIRLRRERCHILHFIGHGSYDRDRGEGMLALEDGEGGEDRIGGRDLGAVLHRRKISLAVLNTCEGARHDESDALAGVAQSLIRSEIPAVVAMQSVVTDGAAVTFARHFYQNLAEGLPVDGGLAETRLAMLAAGHTTEWGTPVLYMRSPDGHLFAAPGEPPPQTGERWRGIVDHLRSPRVWGVIALLLAVGYGLTRSPRQEVPSLSPSPPALHTEPRVAPPPPTVRSAFVAPVQPSPSPRSRKADPRKSPSRGKSAPGCPSPPGRTSASCESRRGRFRWASAGRARGPRMK